MSDHRRSARLRQLKAARLVFNHSTSSVSCVLKDISETGCRLSIDPELTIMVPARFELIVEMDGIRAECEKVWARGRLLGGRFLAPVTKSTPSRAQVVSAPHSSRRPTLRRLP